MSSSHSQTDSRRSMSKLKSKWWSGLAALAMLSMAGTVEAQPFVYALGNVPLPTGGASLEHQLFVINAATNRVVAITRFGGCQSKDIAMAPDGTRVYVGNDVGGSISVVSTRTHTVE